ncbi:MAG: Rho termination factor N-terminal domain-containing protein, partial [Acidimicrobiales bacterium]
MSADQALERSVLERKASDELHTIAQAIGVKAASRTKKADLISQILVAAGVEAADSNGTETKPKRTRAKKAEDAASNGDASEPVEPAEAAADGEADRPARSQKTQKPQNADARKNDDSGEPDGPAAKSDNGNDGSGEGSASQGGGRAKSQTAGNDNKDGRNRNQNRNTNEGGGGRNKGGGNQGGGNQGGNQGGGRAQPGNEAGAANSGRRSRRRRGRDRNTEFKSQEATADQQFQGDPLPLVGLLDLGDQGYGFVRTNGYLGHADDAYVSVSQVRRFSLRKGDHIEGTCRPPLGNEKFGALLQIDKVNALDPEAAKDRPKFEELTPLFPDKKLTMEMPGDPSNITARIIDLISPIGKGQRGMIVSPPKAGKTTVIKQIAKAIETNNPEVHLMVLLVDERPEEITDMR